MGNEKIVLILGAGASHPYGFPTMADMEIDIIENFEKYYSKYILDWLGLDNDDIKASLDKVKEFLDKYEGSNLMIDEFISEKENHKYRTLGKLAIACSIINAEKNSRFRKNSYDTKSDWYKLFFKLLYRKRQKNEKLILSNQNISIITFNYDRSLEYFLFDSLSKLHSSSPKKNIDDLNALKIIHVYGQIMGLDWQSPPPTIYEGQRRYIDYRKIENDLQLEMCANSIVTIYEDREKLKQLIVARKLIKDSKRILFLGFGFDEFNLKNLGLPEILEPSHDIFWTQLGLSSPIIEFLDTIFLGEGHNAKSRNPINGNCEELIENYLFPRN